MKFAIIGAGAMGSLFAYHLIKGGFEVTLIDPWAEHINKIKQTGLVLTNLDGKTEVVFPKAQTAFTGSEKASWLLFFVKSYHTAIAAEEAKIAVEDGTIVVTLQNGLGNVEILNNYLPGIKILAGSTAQGAHVLGAASVRHAGRGETIIGRPGGGIDQDAERLAKIFNSCGLPASTSLSIDGVIWGKLLINAAINPLTALLKVCNGDLVKSEKTLKIMELILKEGEAVARAKGIDLPYPDPFEKVKAVAVATGNNRSSMLQDFDRGRPTEVDFINGAIWREGETAGISTPCNELVTLLIKHLEEIGGV